MVAEKCKFVSNMESCIYRGFNKRCSICKIRCFFNINEKEVYSLDQKIRATIRYESNDTSSNYISKLRDILKEKCSESMLKKCGVEYEVACNEIIDEYLHNEDKLREIASISSFATFIIFALSTLITIRFKESTRICIIYLLSSLIVYIAFHFTIAPRLVKKPILIEIVRDCGIIGLIETNLLYTAELSEQAEESSLSLFLYFLMLLIWLFFAVICVKNYYIAKKEGYIYDEGRKDK